MSNLEQVIFADTRSIITLLHARDATVLDALLQSGQRVMISDNVLDEMRAAPQTLRDKFFDWYNARSAGNGQVFTPEFRVPDGSQAGDISLREIAFANKDAFAARFLSDDAGIYLNERNLGFQADRLAARGQYARPYYGTGEFLSELLRAGCSAPPRRHGCLTA